LFREFFFLLIGFSKKVLDVFHQAFFFLIINDEEFRYITGNFYGFDIIHIALERNFVRVNPAFLVISCTQ